MKLGDIASVRSGLVLSRKKAPAGEGVRYPLLNLRSFRPDGEIETAELDTYYAAESLTSAHLSRTGDIIIRLSAPYTAVLIDESLENIVISSNFVIIRMKSSKVLPEYLFWLLNTKRVKNEIYESSTGNMLGAVKPRFFAEYILEDIPLKKQKAIAELNQLARREKALLLKLAEEKEKYYMSMMEKIQEEGKTNDNKK